VNNLYDFIAFQYNFHPRLSMIQIESVGVTMDRDETIIPINQQRLAINTLSAGKF